MKRTVVVTGIAFSLLAGLLLLSGCPQRKASAQNSNDAGAGSANSAELSQAVGELNFDGVQRLNLSVDNGTVRILRADAAPGTVEIKWRAQLSNGAELSEQQLAQLFIESEQRGADLHYSCEYKGEGRSDKPELHADLVLGSDVLPMLMLGNGTLEAALSQAAEINVGNGEVLLSGALSADSSLHLGNGSLRGTLLLSGGNCEVNVGNGEVDLDLDNQSSVKFSGMVGMGSVSTAGGGSQSASADGGNAGGVQSGHSAQTGGGFGNFGNGLKGQIGNGAGELEVNVGMGSLEID